MPGKLAVALERSNQIVLEDLLCEAGYMLPKSANVGALLYAVLTREKNEAFPKAAVDALLQNIGWNE